MSPDLTSPSPVLQNNSPRRRTIELEQKREVSICPVRAQWTFTGAGDLILTDDEPVRTIESGLIPIAKSKSPWLKPLLLWVNFQGPEGPCSLP
jgi:hypothetical protein